jgi:DNA-binding transcriptional regulator YiaG
MGYGQKTVKGQKVLAHRAVMGNPKGKVVMHTCDNPACVNPDHLRIGTQKDNVQDCITKGRRFDNSGCNHPNTHLIPEDIEEIRALDLPQHQIGRIFGISQQAVSKIKRGVRHSNTISYAIKQQANQRA